MSRTNKRAFTLLELLIALFIISLGATLLFRVNTAVKEKRFHSAASQLQDRLQLSQKLALASQSDWQGHLHRSGSSWIFEVQGETLRQRQAPLKLPPLSIYFNDQRIEKEIYFEFTSTGQVLPHGSLRLKDASLETTLSLPH